MWEYKDATDEQLAEASAKHIMSYLNGETKESIVCHYEIQAIADCFLAIRDQLDMETEDRRKLENYCSCYVVNDKENQACHEILQKVLSNASSSKDNLDNIVFLKAALLHSPEYLLTLRRSESLVTHSTQLFSNYYTDLLDIEIANVLYNGYEEVENLFEERDVCDKLDKFLREIFQHPYSKELHDLCGNDKYAEAFELLIDKDYDRAKQFLLNLDSAYFPNLYDANEVVVENFNCDLEYFNIPTDGGFVEFANGIGWRNQSGAKLFDLDDNSQNVGEDLLDKMRSCDDSNRETIVTYRVGEPFFTARDFYHDAPPGGTCMTVIPEAWLDDALKYKEIRQAFENNEILRDIISVKDLQADLEEKSRKDPMAAMFKQAVNAELDESYYSMVDYYNNKGFEDLVYNAGLRMADYPNALKQPKEVISAIYDMVPKETFEKADWNIKESFERDFKEKVAKNKRYQNASAR